MDGFPTDEDSLCLLELLIMGGRGRVSKGHGVKGCGHLAWGCGRRLAPFSNTVVELKSIRIQHRDTSRSLNSTQSKLALHSEHLKHEIYILKTDAVNVRIRFHYCSQWLWLALSNLHIQPPKASSPPHHHPLKPSISLDVARLRWFRMRTMIYWQRQGEVQSDGGGRSSCWGLLELWAGMGWCTEVCGWKRWQEGGNSILVKLQLLHSAVQDSTHSAKFGHESLLSVTFSF